MDPSKKRRFPFIKILAATGVLGGGGAGVYQFYPLVQPQADAEQAELDDTALNDAAAAWQQVKQQPPKVVSFQKQLPPAPVQDDPYAPSTPPPTAPAGRYGVSPPPLPGLEQPVSTEPTITRGQDSGDGLNELPPLPTGPVNPLRTGVQQADEVSVEAREAFDPESAAASEPPAAVAAFADQPLPSLPNDIQTVGAEEPIETSPPAGNPLAGLPMAPMNERPTGEQAPSAQLPPAPIADLPPATLPEESNPLRSLPAAEPPAPEPMPPAPMNLTPMNEPAAATPAAPPSTFQPPAAAMPAAPAPAYTANDNLRSMLPERQPEPQTDSFGQGGIRTPSDGSSVGGSARPGERALEGRQQPTVAIQKFAPAEIQVGKPCKFLIKVRNVGQRPAMNVVVNDAAPSGVQLMATTPPADALGGDLQWKLGTLAPGEERTLEMEVTPVEEGEIGSVAKVTFTGQASVRTKCTKPQLAIRMTAPSKVMVGQNQVVQIEIKNPGTGDATGVVILENVPENLRHSAGPTLEFEVGTLRAGETRKLQLNMLAESPGKVVNLLTAQADGNLQVDQQVEFEVIAPALEVAVDGPKRRYLELPATYTVKVDNPGTASARDVRLVAQLPRGMKFMKANNLGEYDAATHAVYWSLAELPTGDQGHGEVQLTAMPIAAGDHKLQVRGEASQGLKHQASLDTKVEGIAALKFTVIDLEDPIEVGGQTEYEVKVTNSGTKAAENVTVQASVPAGVRVVSAAGDARHQIRGGVVQFEPIRQLAPRSTLTFRVRVQGIRAGDHRLVVEVGSDDLTQPVRKEESTRVFGDE